ncbi:MULTISPECIES: DUF4136 domain-containing protein [Apibacter]|uniref:DUF4136 domain-containing protein n=1 Tax=Apibacter TaxID=1778601 RepID=UPI001C6A4A88|nr:MULTISPECIES: DUF4136 domain-containing protein [Apibacter]QYN51772.1 DUF4136 domain-containing protein [Apibacter sp. ESL0404]
MKSHWLLFILLITLVSCQTNNLSVDYDSGYNFSTVKTYNYYADNKVKLNNKIDSTNFMKNLDAVLLSKGLIKDVDNPDVYVAVEVYTQLTHPANSSVNLGIGGGSGWFGLGTNVDIPINNNNNNKIVDYSFKIDFDDAKTKNLVWTSKVVDSKPFNTSTASRASFYNSSINLLFKKYPPKKITKSKPSKTNYYN